MQNRRVRCPTNQANLVEKTSVRPGSSLLSKRARKLTAVFVQDVVDVAEEAAKLVVEVPSQRVRCSLF